MPPTACGVEGCPNTLQRLKALKLTKGAQRPWTLHTIPVRDKVILKIWLYFASPNKYVRDRLLKHREAICTDHFLDCDKYPVNGS